MTDIEKKPAVNNNNTNNSIVNNNNNNDNNFGGLNIKLKAICKSSSTDTDLLINNLHDCDEKFNRNLINDYYSVDNYTIQPLLSDLNSNNNNVNTNNNISSNRYVNCAEWSEGINSWQYIQPYSYYINYVNLINRKRTNRRFEIEFDEPLGLFIPIKTDNSSANDNYQPRPQQQNQNPINCTTTTAPGYMREITRSNINSNIPNKVFHSNVIYDKSFINISNTVAKRASSAQNQNQTQNPLTQRPPNNSLDMSPNSDSTKPQAPQSVVTSIVEPHIYSDHKTITNNLSKQQQHILLSTLANNSVHKLSVNNDNNSNDSDAQQPQIKSAQKQQQPQMQREKSSLSDFENRNKSFSTQEKIDKIRKTFNAIVNKSQPRGEFLVAPRMTAEYDNNGFSDDVFAKNSATKEQIPAQIQIIKNPNTTRFDTEIQNQLNNYYKQPINQAEAQINSKTSNNLNSHATLAPVVAAYGNLALDGESIMNSEKNLDYIMFARRKQDENNNNLDVTHYRSKKQTQLFKTRNVNTATTTTSAATTTQALNTINDLSTYATSQYHETTLLPPIISGKRINLPHGPHR